MKLWQGREPVAQCYGCDKIIDYGEEYCWHCWEAWRASTAGRRHFARRAQGSSWTYPESHSWENRDYNIWDGGWLSDAAAETAPSSAQWQAMPPPTSLDSGAPAKKARSQPARPQQQPRVWQPKSTGPSSSSGSQLAEAAPPPPAAPLAVPPAVPVAVPEAASTAAPAAAPGPLDSSGRQLAEAAGSKGKGGSQSAEAADVAKASSSGNQSVEAAEAVAATSPKEGGLSK